MEGIDQGGSRMDTDVELATLTSLLELDEFEVVASSRERREKVRRLTLVPKIIVGLCPHCHGVTDERHVCHDRVIADLPMGGQRVELVVRLWQFHCSACDKFFTPRFAALAEGAHASERLLERLAELASHSDVATAARFFGIAEKTAEGWYYDYLERKEPAPHLQPVRSLGIDELSLKKDTGNSAAC
jgi:transposase